MSLPHDYASILNDLNRDVIRFRPLDALQFCANWFARRLEEERKAALAQQAASTAAAAGADAAESAPPTAAAPSPFAAASPFASTSASSSSSAGPFGNANPFGSSSAPAGTPAFSFDPPSRSASIASSAGGLAPAAAAADADDALHPGLAPSPGYNLGRRTSVSAESLAPSTPSDGAPAPKLVIPKSASQLARIRASIASNVLFRNLDAEQEADVLNAMKEVHVAPGEAIIRQGDQGDYFYVVESGSFDIYVRSSSAPSTSSAGTSDDDARVAGSTDAASLGDKKAVAGPSSSFGELALLYAQPRAASVLATQASVLWALDRITFRSILIGTNSRKRSLFEAHLRNVSLFDSLSDAERAKIADALEQRTVEQGARVIEQGERGSEFFIVIDGRAEVRKRREEDGVEESVGRLGAGDYFGELALLNNAPRAASIVALSPTLRLAALSESAFKRLVGPLAHIMSRHAAEAYGGAPLTPVGGGLGGTGPSSASVPRAGEDAPMGVAPGVAPHDTTSAAPGAGMWVGGLGASPFGEAPRS